MTDKTRAELLEECKKAGLKATGWQKSRMEDELAKLEGALPPPPPEDPGPPIEKPTGPRPSGWCALAPMWSQDHVECQRRLEQGLPPGECGCRCHEPSWVRPPVPDGAQLNKFRSGESIDPLAATSMTEVLDLPLADS